MKKNNSSMEHDNAMSPSGLPISNYTKQGYICVHVFVSVSVFVNSFEKRRKFYAIILMF